jgi:hypothetical protein
MPWTNRITSSTIYVKVLILNLKPSSSVNFIINKLTLIQYTRIGRRTIILGLCNFACSPQLPKDKMALLNKFIITPPPFVLHL